MEQINSLVAESFERFIESFKERNNFMSTTLNKADKKLQCGQQRFMDSFRQKMQVLKEKEVEKPILKQQSDDYTDSNTAGKKHSLQYSSLDETLNRFKSPNKLVRMDQSRMSESQIKFKLFSNNNSPFQVEKASVFQKAHKSSRMQQLQQQNSTERVSFCQKSFQNNVSPDGFERDSFQYKNALEHSQRQQSPEKLHFKYELNNSSNKFESNQMGEQKTFYRNKLRQIRELNNQKRKLEIELMNVQQKVFKMNEQKFQHSFQDPGKNTIQRDIMEIGQGKVMIRISDDVEKLKEARSLVQKLQRVKKNKHQEQLLKLKEITKNNEEIIKQSRMNSEYFRNFNDFQKKNQLLNHMNKKMELYLEMKKKRQQNLQFIKNLNSKSRQKQPLKNIKYRDTSQPQNLEKDSKKWEQQIDQLQIQVNQKRQQLNLPQISSQQFKFKPDAILLNYIK